MSGGRIGGPGPQGPPSRATDDVIDADESFADDAAGAQLKNRQDQKLKQARDRRAAESAKRLAQWNKVKAASTFHDANETAPQKNAGPTTQTTQEGIQAGSRGAAKPQGKLAQTEARIEALMDELEQLIGTLLPLEGAPAAKEPGAKSEAAAARLIELSSKIKQIEAQVRGALMHLFSGGFGFRLHKDPRNSFRGLFARIKRWPPSVAPGHPPSNSEEFDSFVSWVFSSPASALLAEDLLW